MPRLTNTDEFVLVRVGDEYGIAPITDSRWGVTVVEKPITFQGADILDIVTICKALNETVAKKKKR
jgi:hypothetical protein